MLLLKQEPLVDDIKLPATFGNSCNANSFGKTKENTRIIIKYTESTHVWMSEKVHGNILSYSEVFAAVSMQSGS